MLGTVHKNIKNLRELKNLNQQYIADNLSLSIRGYSKIENGEVQLTLKRLEEIANILNVSPVYLIAFNAEKLIDFDSSKESFLTDTLLKHIEQNESRIMYLEKKISHLNIG